MIHYSRRHFIKQNSIALLGASMLPAESFLGQLTSSDTAADMLFFDAFTRIGPRRYKHPAEQWRLDDLLRELDHCSISGALVAYTLSVAYDAMYSNLELSDMLRPHPRLFAIWNVLPHHTGEFPDPETLGASMREHGVKAVTINPLSNGWDWTAETSNELLDWLESQRILTITTAAELGGWAALNQFLNRYTSIPLLITNTNWIEQRYLLPLLERHANLHISFDRFQINEGLEYLHKKGCTDQLIFASDTPTMSAGAHRCYVDYAGIPTDARAKIAGGNLTRLLGGLRPPAIHTNRSEDELMTAVRRGQTLPVPVVDMHMHMLHEGLNGAGGAGYRMENGGPEGIFAMMKKIGCIGGGFMSWVGVVSNDAVAGNRLVQQTLDHSPQGFWGLGTFDPTHYTQQQLGDMIPALYADKRIIGMKPYHFYGVEYHHHSYDIWWKLGEQNRLYALIHPTRTDLLEVETLAAKYPGVRWVIAHAGGSYAMADMAISAMQKYANVYAEITLTPVPLGIIEYLVAHVGDDRILYGSDLPMRDPRQQLGWVVFSRLPLSSKKKILGENAFGVIEPCIGRLPRHNIPAPYLNRL